MSLKAGGRASLMTTLSPGDVVTGRVSRVEPYGVFIELDGGVLSGLAHVSELADKFVKNPHQLFQTGQRAWLEFLFPTFKRLTMFSAHCHARIIC